MNTLEQQNLREDTLIIFTGDNGTAREIKSQWNGRAIKGEKGKMTEAGIRVPFIANWPGVVPEGVVREDLIDFSDVLPTFADVAGAEIPEDVTIDGRSFLPQLKGKQGTPRDWIFVQLKDDWVIQSKNWRLRRNGQLRKRNAPYDYAKPSDLQSDRVKTVRDKLRRSVPDGAPDLMTSD